MHHLPEPNSTTLADWLLAQWQPVHRADPVRRWRIGRLALVASCLMSFSGCGPPVGMVQQSPEISDGAGNRFRYRVDGLTEGDHFYAIVVSEPRIERVTTSTSGGGPSSSAARHGAGAGGPNGFTWTWRHGRMGTLIIDGKNFDLENGAVLLVSQDSDKTVVRQLAADVTKLRSEGPKDFSWVDRAKTLVPEIDEFIKSAVAKQSSNQPPGPE